MNLKKNIKRFLKRGIGKGYKVVSFEYEKVKLLNQVVIVFTVSNEKRFGKNGWLDKARIMVPIKSLDFKYEHPVNFCNYEYCFIAQYDLDGTKR